MATKTRVTLEEFLALEPCEPELELMDGEVIQKRMVGKKNSQIVAELIYLLKVHLQDSEIADIDTELRHLEREDEWVFLPDVSVTLRSRLEGVSFAENVPVEVLPDFAIEVLSPDDRAGRVARKVTHYMRAGVPLLWVIDPEAREVTVWRPGGSPTVVTPPGSLDAAPVLPEFSVDLEALFAVLPAE
jgi:Uma2 family endonuclease